MARSARGVVLNRRRRVGTSSVRRGLGFALGSVACVLVRPAAAARRCVVQSKASEPPSSGLPKSLPPPASNSACRAFCCTAGRRSDSTTATSGGLFRPAWSTSLMRLHRFGPPSTSLSGFSPTGRTGDSNIPPRPPARPAKSKPAKSTDRRERAIASHRALVVPELEHAGEDEFRALVQRVAREPASHVDCLTQWLAFLTRLVERYADVAATHDLRPAGFLDRIQSRRRFQNEVLGAEEISCEAAKP